jgi:hypothetical protein
LKGVSSTDYYTLDLRADKVRTEKSKQSCIESATFENQTCESWISSLIPLSLMKILKSLKQQLNSHGICVIDKKNIFTHKLILIIWNNTGTS